MAEKNILQELFLSTKLCIFCDLIPCQKSKTSLPLCETIQSRFAYIFNNVTMRNFSTTSLCGIFHLPSCFSHLIGSPTNKIKKWSLIYLFVQKKYLHCKKRICQYLEMIKKISENILILKYCLFYSKKENSLSCLIFLGVRGVIAWLGWWNLSKSIKRSGFFFGWNPYKNWT